MKNRLNELRKEKGLTLRELADTLRLDYSTLGHIERGRRDFSISSLRRACDYFHVSADYMLGWSDCRSDGEVRGSTLIKILKALYAKPQVSAAELAEQCKMSTRTIYRYIEELAENGVPVRAHLGRGGGFYVEERSKA